MDFTLKTYKLLFKTLQRQGFSFQPFLGLIEKPEKKVVVLRHDVDKLPLNSLEFARIQANAGIRGTYYFRVVPGSWDEAVIKEIAGMGHEVGYHYEDLGTTAQRHNGITAEEKLVKFAIESFEGNLERLRKIVPVKTICMHGSPMSKWDSRLLWKYYDYRDFGIIGEPYFDINFNEVLFLTDTGRRWDGESVSVRDKVTGDRRPATGENPNKEWKVKSVNFRDDHSSQYFKSSAPHAALRTPHAAPFPKFHSTFEIIKAAEEGRLPDKIMMTFHPQRWTDRPGPWVRELVWQNVKNVGKYFIVRRGNQGLGIRD
jgi:hypothetical protein